MNESLCFSASAPVGNAGIFGLKVNAVGGLAGSLGQYASEDGDSYEGAGFAAK